MLLTGVAEALRARLSLTFHHHIILFTKTTAAQNEVAHSYDRVRGLCFLAVIFVASIILIDQSQSYKISKIYPITIF